MKLSNCKRKYYETPVQNGLTVTPAQMAELSAQGIPIGTQQLQGIYEDKVDGRSYDVSPENLRGVDMNDLWNMRQDTKNKLRNLKKRVDAGEINVEPQKTE